jgi:hypothetical protein
VTGTQAQHLTVMLAFTKYKQHNDEVDQVINVYIWYNKCMLFQTEQFNSDFILGQPAFDLKVSWHFLH